MEIRVAHPENRAEIVSIYERSQLATQLPNPRYTPASELGNRLYSLHVIERYVAIDEGRIVGHGLIEQANQSHEDIWRGAIDYSTKPLIEMGGAFVEPKLRRLGIWTALLLHRIEVIREMDAIPVTATWSINDHVKRKFEVFGGIHAGHQTTQNGDVDLFVFPLR